MAHEVFISYRKSISKNQAQILKLKIDEYFGADTAFLDNDDLQIGDQWAEKLATKLTNAQQIIAVIGTGWTECSFDYTDKFNGMKKGQRRIDHTHDWVCKEIEWGCKENKIFSVYMGGAEIGSVTPEDMPDEKPYLSSFFKDVQALCISDAHKKYEFAPIFEKLEKSGLTKKIKKDASSVVLHDFHKYTCDRREQLSQVEEEFKANSNQKMQFYYIIGEEDQAHFGFVNRVAYEKGGHLLALENVDKLTSKLSIEEIVLENISGFAHLKKQLVRELMAKLKINANINDPILEKNLAFICRESLVIQQMESSDIVAFQISIYEDEWDEEETPALVRWFIFLFYLTRQCPYLFILFQYYIGGGKSSYNGGGPNGGD